MPAERTIIAMQAGLVTGCAHLFVDRFSDFKQATGSATTSTNVLPAVLAEYHLDKALAPPHHAVRTWQTHPLHDNQQMQRKNRVASLLLVILCWVAFLRSSSTAKIRASKEEVKRLLLQPVASKKIQTSKLALGTRTSI